MDEYHGEEDGEGEEGVDAIEEESETVEDEQTALFGPVAVRSSVRRSDSDMPAPITLQSPTQPMIQQQNSYERDTEETISNISNHNASLSLTVTEESNSSMMLHSFSTASPRHSIVSIDPSHLPHNISSTSISGQMIVESSAEHSEQQNTSNDRVRLDQLLDQAAGNDDGSLIEQQQRMALMFSLQRRAMNGEEQISNEEDQATTQAVVRENDDQRRKRKLHEAQIVGLAIEAETERMNRLLGDPSPPPYEVLSPPPAKKVKTERKDVNVSKEEYRNYLSQVQKQQLDYEKIREEILKKAEEEEDGTNVQGCSNDFIERRNENDDDEDGDSLGGRSMFEYQPSGEVLISGGESSDNRESGGSRADSEEQGNDSVEAPFLEYKDHCARVLFPNSNKNHPVLKNLEVDTHKAEAIEAGLREFHKLLMNKTFFLTMVRTMEANKYFVGKDRVYVGSLLMVVLQEKMGYCTEMLKQLLRELIEKTIEKKFQQKILFRRSESNAESMLAAWFTFLLQDHLRDVDASSRVEPGNWKRLNTLSHYNVPNNAILSLTSKSNSLYNLVNFSSCSKTASILSDRSKKSSISMKNTNVSSSKPWGAASEPAVSSSADTDNGYKLYHLVKPTEHGPTDSQEKMVTEIYLARLLMMKGTPQKFINDLLESIFLTRTSPLPSCIKYMFDFMDEQAAEHGISDAEVVHAWKSNALPLRFWVNLIKNPHFLFDIQKPTKVEGCLSVVAQTLMDACSTQDHQLTKDSPSSKLLFAKDMYQYRDQVDSYYTEIAQMQPIDDQQMGAMLNSESRQHNGEFYVFSALNELYKYLDQYKESIIDALESNEHAQASRLTGRLKVDEKSKRHGGELVASVLKAHDVSEIFVLCGGHISPILVAAEKLGIKIIDTRHEVTAVFAADAVARLRQTIGVAAVTAGPGLTNTITAVKNAQMAESPLLLIGGAAPTLLKGRGALQDIDQMVLFRPLCKYVARVERLRDIIPSLRQAISVAKSGCPGPVFVEFPVDVLYPYELVVKEIGFNPNAKGFIQKALNYYLRCHVSRQFGGAFIPTPITPLPTNIPLPKSDELSKIVELVKNSKHPVLLIGSQATRPPIKPADLINAVEKLGCPVFLGGMSRGLLGKDHKQQVMRRDALKDADLTILAGTVCHFRLSYGRKLSNTKIVAINRNQSQLTKNEKAFWNADVSLKSDVAITLIQVSSLLGSKYSKPTDWINQLRAKDDEKEVKWLEIGAFGTLGVGGGFALGAKVVHPDRPVYIIWGDGSCGYSLMEFDTFARHKLPVIGIIGNDACWTQIAREQVPMSDSAVAVDLARTRYDNVAISLGSWGAAIDDQNVKKTTEILNKAVELSRGDKRQSALINVLIGKTDFREGSISV